MKYLIKTPVIVTAILVLLCGCGGENATDQPASNKSVEAPITSEDIEGSNRESADLAAPETESDAMTGAVELVTGVEISFDITRTSTHASNQFAIWIEDESGALVRTVYVTDFTAGRRGYRVRDMSLSAWVTKAQPEELPDSEIAAISGATPQTGRQTLVWDMTDTEGKRVPDGTYHIMLEGTLYWESNVLYTAVLDTEKENTASGTLPITSVRSEPDNAQNEEMLSNVTVTIITEE